MYNIHIYVYTFIILFIWGAKDVSEVDTITLLNGAALTQA